MLTILTTMQGKARQSRRKANKTVMPRASHVTPGRPYHTGEAKMLIGRSFFFLHDTRQFTAKVRSVRLVRQSVQLCNHLERSSQGLLGLIREQGIESLNQAIRCSPLDDCTDLAGKPS